jgi:subtilisin family serine protease
MKKCAFLVVLFLFFININIEAQSNYYFANYQRQYWREDSTSINIIVANMQNYNLIVRNLQTIFSANNDTVRYGNDDDNIIVISDKLKITDLQKMVSSISPDSADISFVTYAKKINNRRLWLRNEAYVKLKNNVSDSSYLLPFLSHFSNYTLDYDSEESDYKITCNNEVVLLQIANGLYDTQYVYYSSPDFYSEMSLNALDPYYGNQWALNNIGQEGGEVGVDIKAEKAWEFLQHYNDNLGDSIRVAVIDDGVDTLHEDLTDALGHRRVLDGFPSSFGKGYPKYPRQFHGTACAGVIAASHNNIGVAGIAPNALIVPIRIQRDENDFFSGKRIQKAITKAWEEYNAQVLNVTWIGNPVDFVFTALQEAMDQGRDGKGCAVIVASGNDGHPHVEFPARVNNVIAVGAVDRCGYRAGCSNWTTSCDPWLKNASSYGSELSVVAPGSNVYSTDRMGVNGIVPGNYALFEGTSVACAHVSGIIALMLSVNPNLTYTQIKEIIEKTAQKVGGYYYEDNPILHPNGTWYEEVGYGMVNAIGALAEAKIYGIEYAISGLPYMQLCNEYTYTLSGNVPEGYEIVWEVNPQMAIVSGQGTSTLVVRPIYPAMYNWLRAKVCFEGETIREVFVDNIVSTGSGHQLIISHDSILTQNALWNNERTLANTAIVDSGSVLTITNTIHCTDNARLIVRPGGKLIVDGGTLTSACPNEMWQGIEVVGDRTKQQLPQYQGKVELKNGATIENAWCGIRTGLREDTLTFATTGGIISATNATFKNNRQAVVINSYTSTGASGNINDYVSMFSRCTFTVDMNNLFAANGTGFAEHARIWDVKGVTFEGCSFNNSTNSQYGNGRGIYAEDAGVIVKTYCTRPLYGNECECPENLATYSTFSGFTTAMEINTTGNQYAVRANSVRFSNNGTAVRINSNNYATVTRCHFDLQSAPYTVSNTGLRLDNCTGYKVEANTFNKITYTPQQLISTGIYVNNSGVSPNLLHLNSFSNLNFGIRAAGNNGGSWSGLQFTCNNFSRCGKDFYVGQNATVAKYIGSIAVGADNEFENTRSSSLYNAGSQQIVYRFSSGSNHNPYNPVNITAITVNNANSCASTLCGGIPDPGSVTSFSTQVSAYTVALAANNDNTDGTNGDTAVANNCSPLQEMHLSLSDTYYTAVRALMADSLLDLAALEQWHTAAQPIADPYSLTETRFCEGYAETFTENAEDAEMANYAEFHAMKLVLRNNVADNDGSVETCHGASLQDGHINWYALTPAQIAQLQTISERNTGRASVMAKGVLCFFFDICYEDGDLLADEDGDADAETRAKHTAINTADDAALTVYPNPTDDLLHIELSGGEIANVALHDLQGRVVEALRATSLQGATATLNMKSVPAGVYLLRVMDADGKEYHRKIVKR